jgi:hypothetical protein
LQKHIFKIAKHVFATRKVVPEIAKAAFVIRKVVLKLTKAAFARPKSKCSGDESYCYRRKTRSDPCEKSTII